MGEKTFFLWCPNCGKKLKGRIEGAKGVYFEHPKNSKCKARVAFEGNGWWSVFSCPMLRPYESLRGHQKR